MINNKSFSKVVVKSPLNIVIGAITTPKKAITWFQKAMQAKRYESPAYPHLNLGRVYERKGNWTEAIESYKKALALDPNYAIARKALGRLVSSLN